MVIPLRESFTDWNNIDIKESLKIIPISLTESNKTISLQEGTVNILGAFKIPIWRLGEKNRNGRIYEESLADKIIKENKITPVLDGHPSDSYIPKLNDIIAVAKNPTKELYEGKKIMFAEVYFVKKELYDSVNRALILGLSLEQSSSGLGELKEDDITVNTDNYFLERYCDLLIVDSSGKVSFSKENEIVTSQTEATDLKSNKNNIKENLTINTVNNINEQKETIIMDKAVTIPINLLRKQIERYIGKASKLTELNDKLKAYSEIKEWIEDAGSDKLKDINEKVELEIKTILEKKEELSIKGQKTDTLEESLVKSNTELNKAKKDLFEATSKLDLCYEQLDSLKQYSIKYKEMFDIQSGKLNTMVEAEDYLNAKKFIEKIEADKQSIVSRLELYKTANKKLKNQFESFVESVKSEKLVESKRLEAVKQAKLDESIKLELMNKKREIALQEKLLEEEQDRDAELDILQQRTEVKSYFLDLCESYGKKTMKEFETSILSCRTLREAQIVVVKLRDDIESLSESHRQSSGRLNERTSLKFNAPKQNSGLL
jgi:hypothetical protein